MQNKLLISSLSMAVIFALSACGSSDEPVRQRPPPRPPRVTGGGNPGVPGGPLDPSQQGYPDGGPGPQQGPVGRGVGRRPAPGPGAGPVGGPGAGPVGPGGGPVQGGPIAGGPGAPQGGPDDGSQGPQDGVPAKGSKNPGPSRRKVPSKQAQAQRPDPNADQEQQDGDNLGSSKSSQDDKSVPITTMNGYKQDLANLKRAENGLQGLGLAFQYGQDEKGGQAIEWGDESFLNDNTSKRNVRGPLQNYLSIAQKFSQRYKSEILDKGNTRAFGIEKAEVLRNLGNQILLIQKTLEVLNQ